MSKRLAKKVLVIGWDAADWKIINPLLDAGLMPALEKLINKGSMGNLATLDPPLSPILWTSIGTGQTADKHGILNFVEPNSVTGDIQPVTVTSRKIKAVWNILTQEGFKTHLVGWWPSHPAEPINGVCVSNFYQKAVGKIDEPWSMAAGTIHPKELESIFEELRVHPGEITMSHIFPFVPKGKTVDQEKDKSFHSIAIMLAQASSIQSAATWILQNKEWDFVGVYFDTIDHFCHGFMKYHPPQIPGIPDEYFDLYKDVVSNAYRFQDMMLERLVELAGEDATIILLSDHGFHSDHLRPLRLPEEPAAPALEHSPYGIICMAGNNIKADERIFGATLLDITPTILTLFGLPIGKDMDGKPLLQAFTEPITPDFIESWEKVEGESGMHSSDQQMDPWAAQEAMQQLIELGYVEPMEGDKQARLEKTKNESDFYLARVFIHSKKYDQAITILNRLYSENPNVVRYGLRLAACYQQTNKIVDFRRVIESLREKDKSHLPQLDLLEGTLLLSENKIRQALEFLMKAENTSSHVPYLHIQIGNVFNKMKRWPDAERSFLKAISIDENSAIAHHGLGLSYLRQKKYEDAADEFFNAIGLIYFLPDAHYHLGEALFNLEEYESAAQAFNVCISMSPGFKKAHQWLIKIYDDYLKQPEKAEQSRMFIKDKIKGTIYIVSGLPRSGTSMMMQMLHAGGLNILTDNLRSNDDSNPKGYMEFEKVKKLAQDSSWINEADGKVLKVIAQLLQHLPNTHNYKIVFMQREMNEVLKSQQKMLGRDTSTFPMGLADTFQKQLERSKTIVSSMPNMEIMYVNYSDIIENPFEQAENVNAFLGLDLNMNDMVNAVDKNLYRTKN
jgi:predicted AlkP superfamily phosphohydrolase/phosphomutase/Flp pilus assembly protein TadD